MIIINFRVGWRCWEIVVGGLLAITDFSNWPLNYCCRYCIPPEGIKLVNDWGIILWRITTGYFYFGPDGSGQSPADQERTIGEEGPCRFYSRCELVKIVNEGVFCQGCSWIHLRLKRKLSPACCQIWSLIRKWYCDEKGCLCGHKNRLGGSKRCIG